MKKTILLSVVFASLMFTSCTVVRPGQVAVKQRLGKLNKNVYSEGIVGFNPFLTKVIKTSTQTNNLKLVLNLPSKEGLSVTSEISILHRIEKDSIANILRTYGPRYESIIASVFRSASSDVCAKYFAKDMHSGMRADIEKSIQTKMEELLEGSGIVIESVLMKSIKLPNGLATSIEQKLQAEQDALRMKFILQQEKLEADRKIIEATGTRDAQKILAEGLTPEIIKLKSIEAFRELSKSPNSKIIVTDGKAPLLID
jgi:regulator of protease activity HflC (stomatin/prohibitin superfamily)